MKEFEEEAKFTEAGEKAAELDKRRWEFFIANGAEFLEKYGQVKVYRLISKFMARVVEQIDRYRKDRTLGASAAWLRPWLRGRIRRESRCAGRWTRRVTGGWRGACACWR